MTVWILLTLLLGIAAAFAAAPFLRLRAATTGADSRAIIYERQISEINQEEQHGAISAAESSALRIEAQRRLLSVSKDPETKEASLPLSHTTAALVVAGMVIVGGVSLYAVKGSPTVPSSGRSIARTVAAQQPVTAPAGDALEGVDGMIGNLAKRLNENPNDTEGWRMLGWSYFSTGQHEKSAAAYGRAAALAPENADYLSAQGEALVMAAGGFVTDDAIALFDETLARNVNDPRARFFKGLALDQAGDPPGAISAWITMVNDAPPDADWVSDLRARITSRAAEVGINVGDRLASAPQARDTARPRGPTLAQINAALGKPEDDRNAMIEGMVASLAARLKENPNDADGWIRLIRSRMVLGHPVQARNDLETALAVFSDMPETRARIVSEAKALGVRMQ